VVLRGEKIAEINQGASIPAGAIDCGGDYLALAIIELHTDNRERHIQPRLRADWPHDPAIIAHGAELAGNGIATVFDAMRVVSIPQDGTYSKYARGLASELWDLRESGALKIGHFLHLRAETCSETLVEEMAEFGPEDRVGIVSLMDHTPGQRQFRNIAKLEDYIKGKHGLSDAGFIEHIASPKEMRDRVGDLHEAKAVVAEARRYGAVPAAMTIRPRSRCGCRRVMEFTSPSFRLRWVRLRPAMRMTLRSLWWRPTWCGAGRIRRMWRRQTWQTGSFGHPTIGLRPGDAVVERALGDMSRAIAAVTANPARHSDLGDRGRIEVGFRAELMQFRMHGAQPLVRSVWVSGTTGELNAARQFR